MHRIIIFAATLAFLTPAAAQETGALPTLTPTLKRAVTVESDVVRLADLIDNAGPAGSTAIFRAPDLGETGPVAAKRVLDAARARDVTGVDSRDISEVMVTRASRSITPKDFEASIVQAIANQYAIPTGNLALSFDRDMRTLQVEPTVTGDLQIVRLSYEPRSGHFEATLDLPGSGVVRRTPLRFSGTATETVEAAMLVRPLARGEIIRQSDLTTARRPKAEAGNDGFSSVGAAVGFAVRNNLQTGQMLRPTDFMKPELVQRNETVTLVFEVPGIMLTVRGKALEAGAEGDFISVQNVQSKRSVQGTVTGVGTVTVAAARPRIAANIASTETALNPRTE
jgi:flagella basal body P-ring formation protein FlgA